MLLEETLKDEVGEVDLRLALLSETLTNETACGRWEVTLEWLRNLFQCIIRLFLLWVPWNRLVEDDNKSKPKCMLNKK